MKGLADDMGTNKRGTGTVGAGVSSGGTSVRARVGGMGEKQERPSGTSYVLPGSIVPRPKSVAIVRAGEFPGEVTRHNRLYAVAVVDVRLNSEANAGSVWSKGAAFTSFKRKADQKMAIHWAMRGLDFELREEESLIIGEWQTSRTIVCVATITRVGKRKLDSDNLARSAKAVRDAIASNFGIDDGDEGEKDSRWDWRYKQEIGKAYAVKIELEWRPL